MKNIWNIRWLVGLLSLVVLIGGLGSGPAPALADCHEGPWATVGRFGYGSIAQLAYSPDGVRVAVGGSGGVTIWNTEKETVEQVLEGHTDYVSSVAWSPDGTQLASGGGFPDNTVWVWAADDGRLVRTLTGHTDRVWSVAWSPDGTQLASGSWDRTVRVWAADDGRLVRTLTGHTDRVWSVAWSPDGTQLASGS
ncbi:MAG: WD40 repeat domain-containing protein, partial [Acidobacteria bacterium]|nr:WD40 repeat domain-containing protein [Acidobacteriota bacterium]